MKRNGKKMSRTSNIESDKSQNGGLEDYNYISDGIFPHFTTPSIKNKLRVEQICRFFQIIMFFRAIWTVLFSNHFQKNGLKNWSKNIWSQKNRSQKIWSQEISFKNWSQNIGPKILVPKTWVQKFQVQKGWI